MRDIDREPPTAFSGYSGPRHDEVHRPHLNNPGGQALSIASRHQHVTAGVPLAVDLDGTLIRSDMLIETAFAELGRRPHSLIEMLGALSRGKAALKHRLAERVDFDPSTLPYDEAVLDHIRTARAEGREVYLASASHERLVKAVADHLGLFDGYFASDSQTNCGGRNKAQKLVAAFGEGGFDYIGNDAADLPVWDKAARAIAIRASRRVGRDLGRRHGDVHMLSWERPDWRSWARLARTHQYPKNALLFVPLITAHVFEPVAFLKVLLAFVAFSLCASSVYILNDLVDLQDDRRHRTKCNRPLANGTIPLSRALVAIPLLLATSMALAASISLPFLGVLAAYYVVTTGYSFWLKRKALLDVLALAGLYTLRVIGGAVVLGVAVSAWLLAFSAALFLSLALIKRFVELAARLDAHLPDSKSRGYRNTDADLVMALATASGLNAVVVFILYVSSESMNALYSTPQILWLAAPVLTYWIARMLLLAHRRVMDDDPVAFATRDRESVICGVLICAVIFAGT
ncbi:UbiA family prenyltransferase [Paracoccus benzoatiresistens]|uniref:UbiA family prenyltransferase n=1 Tax=Paracoccus benzoatiresistens TaxID=2997341 RepID=A0ABT4J9I1_9RHOB|nr:UbiA family prenyltransferase [Paracoccus sp. EF6]MCZ0963745.1 UbiA family prenyltransferase [Paracoccus sp. EF6]